MAAVNKPIKPKLSRQIDIDMRTLGSLCQSPPIVVRLIINMLNPVVANIMAMLNHANAISLFVGPRYNPDIPATKSITPQFIACRRRPAYLSQ